METSYAQQENLDQDEFNKKIEAETPEVLDKLMDGLVKLYRSKDRSGELASGEIELPLPTGESLSTTEAQSEGQEKGLDAWPVFLAP